MAEETPGRADSADPADGDQHLHGVFPEQGDGICRHQQHTGRMPQRAAYERAGYPGDRVCVRPADHAFPVAAAV